MPGRVIEILTQGTQLSKERGFLRIKKPECEDQSVPLADIATVIISTHATLSARLVTALHEQGANLIITGGNYHPAAFFWPQSSHTEHVRRLNQQIEASQPLKKRLWQQVVRFKIRNQSAVLSLRKKADPGLEALAGRVRSGDPDNCEAQAARRYWPQLMGTDFRRNTDGADHTNILLNYGYAVIRAAMARAVCACGLNPSLGIHHRNLANPFCLVDDLMEPYRPLVDDVVAQWGGSQALDPKAKRTLTALIDAPLVNAHKQNSPASLTMLQVAQSLCTALESGKGALIYPRSALPSPHLV